MAPTKVADRLYVADIRDVQTLNLDTIGIDVVVGICQDDASDNVGCPYHFFNLSDGMPIGHNPGEFEYEIFENAVDTVRRSRDDGETVLVHCHAGQSRSVSVCAAAMAVDDDYSLDEAYWHIRTTRDTDVSNDLQLLASMYVNRHR